MLWNTLCLSWLRQFNPIDFDKFAHSIQAQVKFWWVCAIEQRLKHPLGHAFFLLVVLHGLAGGCPSWLVQTGPRSFSSLWPYSSANWGEDRFPYSGSIFPIFGSFPHSLSTSKLLIFPCWFERESISYAHLSKWQVCFSSEPMPLNWAV